MKIHGKTISGANVEYAVIPRPSGNIVFKCNAILDYKEFEQLVPEPKPGVRLLPGGKLEPNPDDNSYKEQVKDFNSKRFDFMVIKSLQGTEGFEWDTVKLTDPNTWKNYDTEFKDAGFTQNEINYIVMQCMTANSLNQEKLEQARKDFLASLQAVPAP